MTLGRAAAHALQTHVRAVTRGRNFLVWFDDSANSRAAGLPPPTQQTPPALRDVLVQFSPAQHQVVYGSTIPYIQHIMPQLLPMGVCLVKRSPTATRRFFTKNEENNALVKAHAHLRRVMPGRTNAEYSDLIQNGLNKTHARPGKRTRR